MHQKITKIKIHSTLRMDTRNGNSRARCAVSECFVHLKKVLLRFYSKTLYPLGIVCDFTTHKDTHRHFRSPKKYKKEARNDCKSLMARNRNHLTREDGTFELVLVCFTQFQKDSAHTPQSPLLFVFVFFLSFSWFSFLLAQK